MNSLDVGAYVFTYNIAKESEGCMSYETWVPRSGFRATSLAHLLDELSGSRDVQGLRITFTGPGFFIRAAVFNEPEFQRLHVELNDQICRLLVARKSFRETISVHVQLSLLKNVRPASHWIFW